MSGSIQSSDYVPGVSGWKFNEVTGEFEIHSSSASTIPDPQPITITAGQWSDSEWPCNALEFQKFISDEIAKIPVNYWRSAEFSTKDFSFDCDGSDVRTTLTYVRQETPSEVAARIKKGSISARLDGFSGANFSIFHDGQLRMSLGSSEKLGPFIIADGKCYMRQSPVDDASITSPWPAAWGVKMKLDDNGRPIAYGIGLGIEGSPECLPDIVVRASHMEILPDGLVKITQAQKKS